MDTTFKIIGIDDNRPPKVSKKPYIDLFFKLSKKAPKLWCENFNTSTQKLELPVKIKPTEGLFIETYVRDMSHIIAHLKLIQQKVSACNGIYSENLRQIALADSFKNESLFGEGGKQGLLNTLIAELDFGEAPVKKSA